MVGSQACLGHGAAGADGPAEQRDARYRGEHRADSFWGCDPETTPWGWAGADGQPVLLLVRELGIKQIYICPDLNYGAAVHADKWIPIRPNTDAALQLAIAYLDQEGTYDKEYLDTHAFGFDKFEDYVMGKEDGVPKTPEWAAAITRRPVRTIKALASDWASKRTSIAHSQRRRVSSAGRTPPSRPGWRSCSLPCRVWASRGHTRSRCSSGDGLDRSSSGPGKHGHAAKPGHPERGEPRYRGGVSCHGT